jgi:hypothetical protein
LHSKGWTELLVLAAGVGCWCWLLVLAAGVGCNDAFDVCTAHCKASLAAAFVEVRRMHLLRRFGSLPALQLTARLATAHNHPTTTDACLHLSADGELHQHTSAWAVAMYCCQHDARSSAQKIRCRTIHALTSHLSVACCVHTQSRMSMSREMQLPQ